MGGIGSGNYYRGSNRTAIEETKRVDLRYMRRNGLLKVGTQGTLSWKYRGESSGSIDYAFFYDQLVLSYRVRPYGGDWEQIEQRITIERAPCNYGNTRVWLRCPQCNRRCAVLCCGDRIFSCRKCYRLPYFSQLETPLDRLISKRRKLEERIWGDKRRRMTKKTYNRLYAEYETLSSLVDQGIFQKTGQYF